MMYQGMIAGLENLAEGIRELRKQFQLMTERYFEPLERRSTAAYAVKAVLKGSKIERKRLKTVGVGELRTVLNDQLTIRIHLNESQVGIRC